MRRVTELLRNLLGLDDGATTTLAQFDDSPRRIRWRIGIGAGLILGAVAVVITIVVSSIAALGSQTVIPNELLASSSFSSPGESGVEKDSSASGVTSPGAGTKIFVHVVGAVVAPGLYAVSAGARVIDAVMAAGGLAEKADPCAINLAQSITDGQQIVVPATKDGVVGDETLCTEQGGVRGNAAEPMRGSQNQTNDPSGGGALVSLGSASVAELDTLPGIGPALAQRILDWRDASGGFTSIEQLNEISGIGDKVMANIRDLVTL